MYGPSKGMYKTSNNSDLVEAIAVRNDVQVLVLESASESTVDSRLEHPVQAEAIRSTIEQNVASPGYQITVVPNSGNNAFLVRRLPESGREILSAPVLQESPRSAGNIFLGGTERLSVNRRARSDNDIKKRSKSDEYILANENKNLQDSRRMLMFLKKVADERDMMNVERKSNSDSHRRTVSGRTRRTIIPVIPIKKQRRNVELNSSHNQQSINQFMQNTNFVTPERSKIFPRMARLASLKCIRYDKRPLRSMKARFQHLRPLSFNRQSSGYDDDYNDPDPEDDSTKRKTNTIEESYDENNQQPTAQAAEAAEAREFHCVCEEGIVCRVSKQQYNEEQVEEEFEEYEELEEFEEFEEIEENEENEEHAEPEPSHHSSTRSPTRSVQDTVQYQYCNEDVCPNISRNATRSPIRSSHICDCMESTPPPMQPYDYCTIQSCVNQQEQNHTVSSPRPIERSRQNCECKVVVTNNISQSLKATDYCAIPSNHSRSPSQNIQNQQGMRQSTAGRSRQNCECNENVYYANQTYQQTNQLDTYATSIPQDDYCTNETCFIDQNQSVRETHQENASNWDCNSQTCNNRNRNTDWNVNQNVPINQIALQKSGQSYNYQSAPNRSCTSQSCNKRVRHDQFSQPSLSNKRSRQGSQNFNNSAFDKKNNNSRSQKCCGCNDCDGKGYGQKKERPSVSDQNRYSPNQSNHSSRRQSQNIEPTVQVRKQTSQKCDCNYYKDSDKEEEVEGNDYPYIKSKYQSDSFRGNNSFKNDQLQQRSNPINSRDPCNKRSCTSRQSRQNSLYSKSNAASKSKRSFCQANCNSSHSKHYNNRSSGMNQSYAQSQNIAVSRVLINQSRNAYEQLTKYEPCTRNICPQQNNLLPVKSPKISVPYHINASQQNHCEPCANNTCPQQIQQFSVKSPKNSTPFHINATKPCTNKDCSQQRPQPCTNNDCSQQRPLPCTNNDCSQQYAHPSTNQNYVTQQNQYVPCTANNVYPQNVPLQNEYEECICNSHGQQECESCSSSTSQQQQDYYLDGPCDENVCPIPVAQNNVFADPTNTFAVNAVSKNPKYPCNECEMDNGNNATCPGRRKRAITHTITCRIGKMRNRLLGRSKKANKNADECECNPNDEEPGVVMQCAETVQQEYEYNRSSCEIPSNTGNVCGPNCNDEITEEVECSGRNDSNLRHEAIPDYSQNICVPSCKPPEFECVPECGQNVCDPTCMPPEYECDPDCISAPMEDYSITEFPQSEVLIKKVYDYCECTSSHTYSSHSQKVVSSSKPTRDKISDSKRLEPPKGKSSCVCSDSSNGRSSFKGESSSKNYDLKNKNISQSCDCADSTSKKATSTHNRLRGSDFCDGEKTSRKADSTRKGYSEQKRPCMCSESNEYIPECPPPKLDKETQLKKTCKCKLLKEDSNETQLKNSCKCKLVKDDMDSNEDIPPKKIPKCPPKLVESPSSDDKGSQQNDQDSTSSDHKLKARQYCNDKDFSRTKPNKEECKDEDSKSNIPDCNCKEVKPQSKKRRKRKEVKDMDSNEEIAECPPPKPDKGSQPKKRRKSKEVKDMGSYEDIPTRELPECPDEDSSDHKLKSNQYCMDNDANSDEQREDVPRRVSNAEKRSKAKSRKVKEENETAEQEKDIKQPCDEEQPIKRKAKKKCKKAEEEEEIIKPECACKDDKDSDKDLECNNEFSDSDHKLKASYFCEKEKRECKTKCYDKNQEEVQTLRKLVTEENSCCCRSNIGNKQTEPYVSEPCVCEPYVEPKKGACESQDTYNKKTKYCFEKPDEVFKGVLKASDYCNDKRNKECDVTNTSCECVPPKKPSNKSIQICSCHDREDDKEDVCVCNKKPRSKPKTNSGANCSRECKRFSGNKNKNEFHDCAETTDMSNASLCNCRRTPTRSEICDENCVALKHKRSRNISKSCESSERSKPRKDLCGCNKEDKVKGSTKNNCACYENDDDSIGAERNFKERPRSKSGTCCKTFWDSQPNVANMDDTVRSEDYGRSISDRSEHKLAKSVSQYESQRYHNTDQRSKRRNSVEKCSSHENHSKQGSYNRRSRNGEICDPASQSSRRRSRYNCDKDSRQYGSNQRSQSIHRSNKDTYSNCSSETRHSFGEQNHHNSSIDRNCKEKKQSHNSYYSECVDQKSVIKETSRSLRNSNCNGDNRSMRETSSCNKPSTSTAKKYNRYQSRRNSSDDDDDEESIDENKYHLQNEIGSSCCSHKSDNFIVYNCDSDTNSCDYSYESESEEVVINDYNEEKTYITIKDTKTNIKVGTIINSVSICKKMELAKSEYFDIDKIERSKAPPKNPNNIFLEDYTDPKKSKKRKTPVTTSNISEHPTFDSTAKDSVRSMGGFCNKRNRRRRNRRTPELNPTRSLNTEEILENVTNTDANEQVNIIYVNHNWGLNSSPPSTADDSSIHTIRSQRNTRPRNSPN